MRMRAARLMRETWLTSVTRVTRVARATRVMRVTTTRGRYSPSYLKCLSHQDFEKIAQYQYHIFQDYFIAYYCQITVGR